MRKNLKQTILFILIVIGLPILINLVVEAISNIVTMDMIVKCVYLTLGLSIIYILKEAR